MGYACLMGDKVLTWQFYCLGILRCHDMTSRLRKTNGYVLFVFLDTRQKLSYRPVHLSEHFSITLGIVFVIRKIPDAVSKFLCNI